MAVVAFFLACTLHWGTPPATAWQLAPVAAAVAEPGIDLSVTNAVIERLSLRNALGGEAAPRLSVSVLQADWNPAGRSGETVLYEARLVIRIQAGTFQQSFSAFQTIPDPGSAGAALPVREAVFAQLAQVVAAAGVNWLLNLPPP